MLYGHSMPSHHAIGDSLSPVYPVGFPPIYGAWIVVLLGIHLEAPVNK